MPSEGCRRHQEASSMTEYIREDEHRLREKQNLSILYDKFKIINEHWLVLLNVNNFKLTKELQKS